MQDAKEQKLTIGKQMTGKSTEGKGVQPKKSGLIARGNRVEGVIRAPAGKEEAGWSGEQEFETHSMKGRLQPHRTCLLCCRNSISHFCSLYFERES